MADDCFVLQTIMRVHRCMDRYGSPVCKDVVPFLPFASLQGGFHPSTQSLCTSSRIGLLLELVSYMGTASSALSTIVGLHNGLMVCNCACILGVPISCHPLPRNILKLSTRFLGATGWQFHDEIPICGICGKMENHLLDEGYSPG